MNQGLLKINHQALSGWQTKFREETISTDRKLDLVLFFLSELFVALGTDGTQESIDAFYGDDNEA